LLQLIPLPKYFQGEKKIRSCFAEIIFACWPMWRYILKTVTVRNSFALVTRICNRAVGVQLVQITSPAVFKHDFEYLLYTVKLHDKDLVRFSAKFDVKIVCL
jgi:hypothetical protein